MLKLIMQTIILGFSVCKLQSRSIKTDVRFKRTPITSRPDWLDFDCSNRNDGYYADTVRDCHIYIHCINHTKIDDFLCPRKMLFHQERQLCDWKINVNCSASHQSFNNSTEASFFKSATVTLPTLNENDSNLSTWGYQTLNNNETSNIIHNDIANSTLSNTSDAIPLIIPSAYNPNGTDFNIPIIHETYDSDTNNTIITVQKLSKTLDNNPDENEEPIIISQPGIVLYVSQKVKGSPEGISVLENYESNETSSDSSDNVQMQSHPLEITD